MGIDNKAVFLLTSPEPDRKKIFGTGFAVAHKDGRLYLLTCAHVVEQLGGRVRIGGQEAAIEASGSADSIDLALLRIPCEQSPSLLNRTVRGRADMQFEICGYGPFSGAKDNYVLRDIEGRLGKSIAFESPGNERVEAWDLHVEDDDFSKLQGGYSGSPLCDEQGRLVGVVSHNADPAAGRRGHAVAVANLKSIYSEIEQLIPSFSCLNIDDRIQQAKTELSKRAFDLLEVIQAIGLELDRMEKEGVSPGDEEILRKIEEFIEQRLAADEFVHFFKGLDCRKRTTNAEPDYAKLAENLHKGRVILCLGQELSHLLGAPIPSTEEIIRRLIREEEFHGPLSELCEQEEILPDSSRYELVGKIRGMLRAETTAPIALYDLLARIEHPLLVISLAYDDLLEQSLKNRKPFVVIYPNIWEKKCLLRYSDQQEMPPPCTLEELSSQKFLSRGYTVIYKLRGGFIDHDRETLLLSERDYLNFNQSMQQVPDYIRTKLKNRALWFLGHHPESWEERLLVKSLQVRRDHRAFSLAVQQNISPFAHAFWQDNHVQDFGLALKNFIQELVKEAEA